MSGGKIINYCCIVLVCKKNTIKIYINSRQHEVSWPRYIQNPWIEIRTSRHQFNMLYQHTVWSGMWIFCLCLFSNNYTGCLRPLKLNLSARPRNLHEKNLFPCGFNSSSLLWFLTFFSAVFSPFICHIFDPVLFLVEVVISLNHMN